MSTDTAEATALAPSPIAQFDQTDGYELVQNEDAIPIEATRWLFCAGNTLSRQRMRETGFVYGGLETANRCLKRTAWGNGHYIPRLTFTPLEVWFEALPSEFLSVEPGYNGIMTIKDSKGHEKPIPTGSESYFKSALMGQTLYPGRQVRLLTEGAVSRICEVELKALANVKYDSGIAQGIERAFFPDEFKAQALHGEIPLSAVRARIEETRRRTTDERIQSIADDMLVSCELFETWANDLIGTNHTQLRQRMSGSHTFRYSPVVLETLLPQMEINREDTAYTPNKGNESGGTLVELATILKERDEIFTAQMAAANQQIAEQQAKTNELQTQFMQVIAGLLDKEEKKAPPQQPKGK